MAGNSRWPLAAENDSRPTASYKTRTQSHKPKNLDAADHMEEFGSEFFPKRSEFSLLTPGVCGIGQRTQLS